MTIKVSQSKQPSSARHPSLDTLILSKFGISVNTTLVEYNSVRQTTTAYAIGMNDKYTYKFTIDKVGDITMSTSPTSTTDASSTPHGTYAASTSTIAGGTPVYTYGGTLYGSTPFYNAFTPDLSVTINENNKPAFEMSKLDPPVCAYCTKEIKQEDKPKLYFGGNYCRLIHSKCDTE